jgi:hypothetical protein
LAHCAKSEVTISLKQPETGGEFGRDWKWNHVLRADVPVLESLVVLVPPMVIVD